MPKEKWTEHTCMRSTHCCSGYSHLNGRFILLLGEFNRTQNTRCVSVWVFARWSKCQVKENTLIFFCAIQMCVCLLANFVISLWREYHRSSFTFGICLTENFRSRCTEEDKYGAFFSKECSSMTWPLYCSIGGSYTCQSRNRKRDFMVVVGDPSKTSV